MPLSLRFSPKETGIFQSVPPIARHAIIVAGYFLGWFLLWQAAAFYEINPNISVWYPPAGLTLALLLLCGLSYLPVVFVLELIVGAQIWLPEHPIGWFLFPILITGGYGLVTGTLLHGLHFDSRLRRIQDVLCFIFISILGALLVALIGMLLFVATDITPATMYWKGMLDWWIGDAIGIMILTPLLLLHGQSLKHWLYPSAQKHSPRAEVPVVESSTFTVREIIFHGLIVLLTLWIAFVWFPKTVTQSHGWYLLYLPIIGIAFRYGLRGSTLAVFGINIAAMVMLRFTPTPVSLIDLQIFMLTMALLNMILAVTIEERKTSATILEKARDLLQARADELTATNRALSEEIAERKRAEQELRDLSKVFMNSADPIFITDSSGIVLNLNTQAHHNYGWTSQELVGQSIKTLIPTEHHAQIDALWIQCQRGEHVRSMESPWQSKTGKACSALLTLFPLANATKGAATSAIAIIARDVTKQKQMEAALRQAQKMEAVGQLTGGIAHDFNNLLTIILGNLQLLAVRLDGEPKLYRLAQTARQAGLRGAELTRQLLAYSRRQTLEPKPIDLNQLVQDMMSMLQRTLGETIEVELIQQEKLWQIYTDPHQLETTLVNLAINARDAMPYGGKLTIETANVFLDADYTAREVEVTPGEYVMLAVSDTGMGMPPKIVEQAFEPFFTTKEVGKGSGLGLSMVYGFAKQSDGHVKIYSELSRGTTVKLYLPRSQFEREQTPEKRLSNRVPRRGDERILVVEDDEGVRELTVTFLTDLGYTVLEAADGQDALALFEQHRDIDLLLTDVVMPGGLSGVELAREAQYRYPNLKVLYTSGYTQTTIVHHGRFDDEILLLSKPYQKETLAFKVRQVLGE